MSTMLCRARLFRLTGLLVTLAGPVAGAVVSSGQRTEATRRYVRVPAGASAALSRAAVQPTSSIDYGSFVWLELEQPEFDKLTESNVAYQEEKDAFVLRLGERYFDPLSELPALPAGLDRIGSGPDLHLVQMNGPSKSSWLAALGSAGLQIVQYIHPYTYVVWGPANAVTAVQSSGCVRWAGPFAPAYRLLPCYQTGDSRPEQVRVLMYRGADTAAARRKIEQMGGRFDEVRKLNDVFELAVFDLAADRLADVAAVPGVYSVNIAPKDGGLRGEMSNQVNVNNIDEAGFAFPGYADWLAGVGLSGNGIIIANVDNGVQQSHPDLVDRFLACSGVTCGGSATSSHGTHTAGIMAADGSSGALDGGGFLRALGVAPAANLVEQVYSPFFLDAGGMLLLMTDSHRNGALLSGNSWGPAGSPRGYDDDTMQVDIGVRDADPDTAGNQPLFYVLSMMNGYGSTSTQGTPDEAKNIFTIGSTKMQTSSGAQILDLDDLSDNSGHGPALDGRKIPHMVAPGCRVDSTDSGSGYTLKCGTSMASPHVSGAVALFVERYRGRPGYVNDPSAALIKAAFIAVARDLAGREDADGGILGHPFDSKQGWGRMDLAAVLDPQLSVRYFDDPVVFDNTGEEWTETVTAEDPNQPVRIMLAWTDAPGHGLGGSTPAWNNNLDLMVEAGEATYRGNSFGAAGWSSAGGSADVRNNTEGVFIGPTAPEHYTIRVLASAITSDAIPGVGDSTDQDFAVVCYNCAVEPGFALSATPTAQEICTPVEAAFTVEVQSTLGFSDPITLSASGNPAGTSVEFSTNPVTPPGTSTMTIADTDLAAAGPYGIAIEGEDASTDESRFANVQLNVFTSVPGTVVLSSPSDGATGVSLVPLFEWSAAAQGTSYELEIAADGAFSQVVYRATTSETTHLADIDLASTTQYFWRVAPGNVCGAGERSAVYSFTTREVPPILLVDDDDNAPDVRSFYASAIESAALDYDLWDTENSDNEPDAAALSGYELIIWFTGDEFGGAAGPGSAGEASLANFLDSGGCLFISSQDYYFDRGLTAFMTEYLGVAVASGDVAQTTVTGVGSVFAGFGPYTLDFPFSNYSDEIDPDATAEVAFDGDEGNAGVVKDGGVYHATYWGFPFEAVPTAADREALLEAVLTMCGSECVTSSVCPAADVDCDGLADGFDIGIIRSADNWLRVRTDAAEPRADVNADGVVDGFDIATVRRPECWLR